MKRSKLYETHLKLGATVVERAGWDVPDHYGDAVAEHHTVRNGAGIMDLSHRGKIRITGEDRVKWLQSVISNDILPLSPGQGIYSTFLTHKGKMLSYFRVYQLGEALMLEDVGEIGDVTFSALRKFLLYGTKAKMENCAETWGLILLSGPKALELIRSSFGTYLSSLKPLAFVTLEIGGRQALFIRTEETGETDIEILIPSEGLSEAWDLLWSAGQPLGLKPFGSAALETLRVGCYPGQEVVARMDTYGAVRRRLVGLVIEGQHVPAAGTKLFSGDREVGWLSSAVRSPSLGRVIAFGFPLRDFIKAGTELAVEVEGSRTPASVHPLPFISRS